MLDRMALLCSDDATMIIFVALMQTRFPFVAVLREPGRD
jgi:hypothetical protein